jgi:hypothetical protein
MIRTLTGSAMMFIAVEQYAAKPQPVARAEARGTRASALRRPGPASEPTTEKESK